MIKNICHRISIYCWGMLEAGTEAIDESEPDSWAERVEVSELVASQPLACDRSLVAYLAKSEVE
jgi:hypothetical protein